MPTYPLAYRITNFLERQISWTEKALTDLDGAEQIPDEALEALIQREAVREKEARDLAKEYHGLAYEWKHDDTMDDGEREAIRALSKQAQLLSEQVQQRFKAVQRSTEARLRTKRLALNDLRRGRRSVTIYQPEMLVSPDFVDKEA